MKKHLAYILLFLFSTSLSYGQKVAKGLINDYYKVIGMGAREVTVPDTTDLSSISPGDKVMMIQMTGIDPFPQNLLTGVRFQGDIHNTGNTQFLAVSSVDQTEHKIYFSATIKGYPEGWDIGEKIQLIRMFEALSDASVDEKIVAKPWDGHTGGVVAMVAYETLELNADIDVSGMGFLGAEPVPYTGACEASTDTIYFDYNTPNRGGRKGEGVITVNDSMLVGAGNNLNGGGGGQGFLAGGAGGGNAGEGKSGGPQDRDDCSSIALSSGGFDLDNIYSNQYRLVFGGGGGGTVSVSGATSTKGGNGGGMVVLIADTLIGNGHKIIANGGSVTTVASGAAGGGGAGGTVAIAVNAIENNLTFEVKGGDGGNTNTTMGYCGGPGGGGGAGFVSLSLDEIPSGVTQINTGGFRGTSTTGCSNSGSTGASGDPISTSLEVLLNGFIFNSVYGGDTICAGTRPDTLLGTMPTGGSGNYEYQWLKSLDSVSWEEVGVPDDSMYFQPQKMGESAYFTRAIYDPIDTIYDTAIAVFVYVYDSIENNILDFTDTLCEGTSPGTLTGLSVTGAGGAGSYSYLWQSTTDLENWNDRAPAISLNEGILDTTVYYRRVTRSVNVCFDTSNIDTLTVLKDISTNSFISTDTVICSTLSGGTLKLTSPTGGDGVYRYVWIESDDNVLYTERGSGIEPVFNVGIISNLTASTTSKYYKRIALSGAGDVCVDTSSNVRKIDVLPEIAHNDLSSERSKYCYGETPLQLTVGTTSGGDGDYTYHWQKWNLDKGTDWEIIEESDVAELTFDERYFDTTQFRRITLSGEYDACKDTSTVLVLEVLDSIVNPVLTHDTALCEAGTPLAFTEMPATGGSGSISYQWLASTDNGGQWGNAPGAAVGYQYASPALDTTTLFKRKVISAICTDTSEEIKVVIYPEISGNDIIGGVNQYTCFDSPIILLSGSISGGQPGRGYTYSWMESTNNTTWSEVGSEPAYTWQTPKTAKYYYRVIQSGDLNECIDTSSTVFVQINDLPTGNILVDTDTLCAGEELIIQYENVSGNGPWKFDLTDTTVIIANNPSGSFAIPVSESGIWQLANIEDDSACFADLTFHNEQVDVTVFEVPVANAGKDTSVCGNELTLYATASVGDGAWSANGVDFDNVSAPTTLSTASEYDKTYQLTWTETNWECVDTNSLIVLYSKQPDTVFAGNNQKLDYEFGTTLSANETEYTGTWKFITGSGEFEDSNSFNTNIYFPTNVVDDYYLSWTITNGNCPAITDTVLVQVLNVKFFDGFSPGNDGVNDTYLVKLSTTVGGKLTVLNHYGTVVWEAKAEIRDDYDGAYVIEWDGTNKSGKEVPDGMYFFVLEKTNGEVKKAIIELRR